jgi:hypothetical protein
VVWDESGADHFTLSTDGLSGLHTSLDGLAKQGWLPVLLAYEVLRHFEVEPTFRVLDEFLAHYQEDKEQS